MGGRSEKLPGRRRVELVSNERSFEEARASDFPCRF